MKSRPTSFDRSIPVKAPKELLDLLVQAARVAFIPDYTSRQGTKWFYIQLGHFRKAVTLPAVILSRQGAQLPWQRYQDLVLGVINDAKLHAAPDLRFPGGYFRKVMQQYMRHHWEEWYNEAKAIRQGVDAEMAKHGTSPLRDLTVEIMAEVNAAISTKRPQKAKRQAKPAEAPQLDLF